MFLLNTIYQLNQFWSFHLKFDYRIFLIILCYLYKFLYHIHNLLHLLLLYIFLHLVLLLHISYFCNIFLIFGTKLSNVDISVYNMSKSISNEASTICVVIHIPLFSFLFENSLISLSFHFYLFVQILNATNLHFLHLIF